MSRPDADLIIAGAGCAGLSALCHALHGPVRHRRIIVVDRGFEPVDDRTWAFWGIADAPSATWPTEGGTGCASGSPVGSMS